MYTLGSEASGELSSFTLKLIVRLFERFTVLFLGNIAIAGGFVSSSGGTSPSHMYGLALPKLRSWVPATAENRSTEMQTAVKIIFFPTGDPCLIPSCLRN